MKLFIWQEVLTDYTDGIMIAMAPDRAAAVDLLIEKLGFDHPDLEKPPTEEIDLSGELKPVCWYIYGGG